MDSLHGDVTSGDRVEHSIGTRWSITGLGPSTRDEPQVGCTKVNIRHGQAAHGVDARVGVAVCVHVVKHNVGVGTVHRVNGHTGLSRWVGHRDVGDGDMLQVNIDEVHVGVLNGQVLSVECTSG